MILHKPFFNIEIWLSPSHNLAFNDNSRNLNLSVNSTFSFKPLGINSIIFPSVNSIVYVKFTVDWNSSSLRLGFIMKLIVSFKPSSNSIISSIVKISDSYYLKNHIYKISNKIFT